MNHRVESTVGSIETTLNGIGVSCVQTRAVADTANNLLVRPANLYVPTGCAGDFSRRILHGTGNYIL